jgi:hypothetical protein
MGAALVWGSVLAVSASWTPEAAAQSLGGQGDFVIGAERVFGFYSVNVDWDGPGNGNNDYDATSAGLGFQGPVSVLAIPRVGLDYFIVDSLSLGGNIGFYSNNGDGGADQSGLLFAPRVGYAVPFSPEWGIWPRGGLTYVSINDPDFSVGALSAELPLYFMPAPNVGFFTSLMLDIGLTGNREAGGDDYDYTEQLIGLGFGMFARF